MTPLPWDLLCRDEAETEALGGRLAVLVRGGGVVRLRGELGAGKTCLTRGLARGLGADPAAVHSPTFSLVHTYRDPQGRPVLHHADLYRVDGAADLREIGLEELLASGVPCAVEWGERLGAPPQAGDLDVSLRIVPRGGRRVRVTAAAPVTAPSGSSEPPW